VAPIVEQSDCTATSVSLSWTVEDPTGAPVQKCLIRLRGKSLAEVSRQQGFAAGCWGFTMADLEAGRGVALQVLAVNEAGRGPAVNFRAFTGRLPGLPWIEQTDSQSNSLAIEWTVDDPDGAPVLHCQVQMGGRTLTFQRSNSYSTNSGSSSGVWKASFKGLQPSQKFRIRLTSVNAVGEGRTKEFSVYTSKFDRRAGKVYEMYHGTSEQNARQVERSGFRPSTDGMLGRGVYLSRDLRKAQAYGCVILKCRVAVGKVKIINHQDHPLQKSWAQNGYDTAWVPPNCGMVGSGLEEDCVSDPRKIKVVGRVRA